MRKALIVGINFYDNVKELHGCVNDSNEVNKVLERNDNGTLNFDIQHVCVNDSASRIDRKTLKKLIEELFLDDNEVALFYFSGHGYIETTGGYLITSECKDGDDGLSLNELLDIANRSPSRNKVIIIDACHSGVMGNISRDDNRALISEGMTILTASSADQYAMEVNGSGVFTTLLVDALKGSAANLVGEISPGGIYAHIDQSLGSWQQRPIFKTNVKKFVVIRKVNPPIELNDLKKIVEFFPSKNFNYKLDPSFEPERNGHEDKSVPAPNRENNIKFAILQKLNRINLVVPIDAPHMWHAAMYNKSCELTILGKHYWNLITQKRI